MQLCPQHRDQDTPPPVASLVPSSGCPRVDAAAVRWLRIRATGARGSALSPRSAFRRWRACRRRRQRRLRCRDAGARAAPAASAVEGIPRAASRAEPLPTSSAVLLVLAVAGRRAQRRGDAGRRLAARRQPAAFSRSRSPADLRLRYVLASDDRRHDQRGHDDVATPRHRPLRRTALHCAAPTTAPPPTTTATADPNRATADHRADSTAPPPATTGRATGLYHRRRRSRRRRRSVVTGGASVVRRRQPASGRQRRRASRPSLSAGTSSSRSRRAGRVPKVPYARCTGLARHGRHTCFVPCRMHCGQ